jgi:hypothetical protein
MCLSLPYLVEPRGMYRGHPRFIHMDFRALFVSTPYFQELSNCIAFLEGLHFIFFPFANKRAEDRGTKPLFEVSRFHYL